MGQLIDKTVLRKELSKIPSEMGMVRKSEVMQRSELDECANEGVYCSVCHKKVYKLNYANQKLKSKYCPNCGAIMDGE